MIRLLEFPSNCPFWFCVVAGAWSLLQGLAGFQYGLYIFDKAALDFVKTDRMDENASPLRPPVNKNARTLAYGVHHAVFYLTCSLFGFGAWAAAARLADSVKEWHLVDGGTAALLVALGGFAVAGVSGALPRILYLGGRPV